MSDFAYSLLNKINYHKTMQSSENAINNLQKINPKFKDTNIVTLAYLTQNEALNNEEREIYMQCLREKAKQEYDFYSTAISMLSKGNPPFFKEGET